MLFRSYAKWEPAWIRIALDNQGANLDPGTDTVFERYASGYYKNQALTGRFAGNRIRVPKKQREDPSIPEGVRRQQFLGYYTRQNGAGYRLAEQDGFLAARINGAPAYTYFKEDATVYAHWQDMYSIRFDPNLSARDRELLDVKDPVLCPALRWAGQEEDVTVSNGNAIVRNGQFADLYRFLGWSLTPEISSSDDIILNEEKPAYTFRVREDITLYAQWDTGFAVAYVGNGQSSGADHLRMEDRITNLHRFTANEDTGTGHYLTKTEEKPAMDIATGQMQNDAGVPYTEQVLYRFLGWSVEKERSGAQAPKLYTSDMSGTAGSDLVLEAKEAAAKGTGEGLLFGRLPSGYGAHGASRPQDPALPDEKIPVVTLYAVWDSYPQIFAADMYVPLADAQNGVLTEEYLLKRAKATDEELISKTNPEGVFKPGADPARKTSFTVWDYQAHEFTSAEQEMSLTVTYRAKDAAGNISTRMVRVYLVDTSPKEYDTGRVRFISEKYVDTLAADSVWRTGAYAETLAYALGNQKKGEEYTKVTPMQQAFGIKPVKKPGSGTWDHVQEVWKFTHEQVLQIQEYIEEDGVGGDPSGFLKRFGHCRVQ